jgi:hypothetical protein
MEHEPDYSKMSLADLEDVAAHIDRDLYPERTGRVLDELRNRAERAEPPLPTRPWWRNFRWLRIVAVSEIAGGCLGLWVAALSQGWFRILALVSAAIVGIGGVLLWRSSAIGYFLSVAAQIPQLVGFKGFGVIFFFECGFSVPVGFAMNTNGASAFFHAAMHYRLDLFWAAGRGSMLVVNLAAIASLIILWRYRELSG